MPVSFCDSSMCVSCEQTKRGISKKSLKVNLYFAGKNKYTIQKPQEIREKFEKMTDIKK